MSIHLPEKHEVVTLCGSTKFKDEFIATQKKLALEGKLVLSVSLFGHSGDDEVFSTPGVKEMLDDVHKQKILMSDSIMVINVDGYIGSSTKNEIEWAILFGKKVEFLYKYKKCNELLEKIKYDVKYRLY